MKVSLIAQAILCGDVNKYLLSKTTSTFNSFRVNLHLEESIQTALVFLILSTQTQSFDLESAHLDYALSNELRSESTITLS